jgi:hypothetical protein
MRVNDGVTRGNHVLFAGNQTTLETLLRFLRGLGQKTIQ